MQMSLDMHGLDLSRDPDPAYENLSVDSVSLLSRFFSLSSSSRPRTSTSPRCRVCANTNDFEHTRAHAPGDRRGEQGAATNERRARCRRPLPEPRRSPLAPCRSQAPELNHAIASAGHARSTHAPAPLDTTRLGLPRRRGPLRRQASGARCLARSALYSRQAVLPMAT